MNHYCNFETYSLDIIIKKKIVLSISEVMADLENEESIVSDTLKIDGDVDAGDLQKNVFGVPGLGYFLKGIGFLLVLLSEYGNYSKSIQNRNFIPIVWSIIFVVNGLFLLLGEQNLMKYQEESTNVSRVSVSLIKVFPVFEHFLTFQSGW